MEYRMVSGEYKQTHPRRVFWAIAMILPVMCISGCGPTRGQILTYEMVLVVVGLLMGLGMWAIGRRIGRRWFARWFICEHCRGVQQARAGVKEGQKWTCRGCEQDCSVTYLQGRKLREALKPFRYLPPRRETLLLAAMFAVLTFSLLCIPWLLVHVVAPDSFDWVGSVSYDWVEFPLMFALTVPKKFPGIGIGLFFYSYHTPYFVHRFTEADFENPLWLWLTIAYLATFISLTAHWYVGLRRWRYGWLLALIVAIVNACIGVAGYYHHP